MEWTKIVEIALAIYGVMTAIVKFFPTIPTKFPFLITIIKFLGNLTNRQTDDEAARKLVK